MQIIPLPTRLLQSGDDLASMLCETNVIEDGDILVVSSKTIATCEGAAIDLSMMNITDEAKRLAKESNQDPAFTQAVLEETKRLNGKVIDTSPYALLTSLQPSGMKKGRMLCPNAGLDRSNVKKGSTIGWPRDPVKSARIMQETIESFLKKSTKSKNSKTSSSISSKSLISSKSSIGIIPSDSCCRPGRLGVTAFALVCAGIDPFKSEVGQKDLFGSALRVTQEAVADQLATAANALMGNASQSTPAAIIRDHGIPFTDFCGWVDGIEPREDLFRGFFK